MTAAATTAARLERAPVDREALLRSVNADLASVGAPTYSELVTLLRVLNNCLRWHVANDGSSGMDSPLLAAADALICRAVD